MVIEHDTSGTLQLKGPPRALEVFLPIPKQDRFVTAGAVIPELPPENQPVVFGRVLSPGLARIRLRFERYVAPGAYKGVLHVGSTEYPLVAEIEAITELRAVPSSLTLSAVSNSEAHATISIANSGNGPYEVRHTYAFGVFHEGGLEEALGKAYRAGSGDKRRWIDRVGDNLTEEHGGLVRVLVEEGSGDLPPGEIRRLGLLFHFPGNLRPGRTYTGEIEFDNLIYPVRIDVPKSDNSDNQEATYEPVPEAR